MSEAQEVRNDLSQELLTLAEILEVNLPGFDAGSLRKAANDCKDPTQYGRNSWGYEVSTLLFYDYEPSANIRPEIVKAGEPFIEVDLKIAGRCEEIDEGTRDPLFELTFDLLIWGEDEERDLLSAWHLDRHIANEEDQMYSDHPIYHFQFGGERMWEQIDDYGGVLLPESPRVAYPPMDAVLATNFVLANFFGDEWKSLVGENGDSEYLKLLSDAQNRFWRPYSQALSAAWQPGPFAKQDWSPAVIWPQLVDSYERGA
jgi:hypothetical protein